MYKFNEKFKGQFVKAYLPKKFKGKDVIFLETATQEELKHVYEEVGNTNHVVISLTPEQKKVTKLLTAAEKDVVRLDKLLKIKAKDLKKSLPVDKEKFQKLFNTTEKELKKAKETVVSIELELEKLS